MIGKLLGDNRVVATVTIDDASTAVATAQALVAGGVNVVEIMLRTDAGLDAITRVRNGVPEAVVGAGTVLAADRLDQAIDAGATFAVSPGLDVGTAERAAERGLPYLAGAVTAAEIQSCLALGLTTLKFFPASTSGGPAAIKALAAAYSVAGVQFVPTGGVDDTNAFDYLDLAAVRAIGMSWLAPSGAIRSGDFDGITARSRQITEQLAQTTDRSQSTDR